MAALAQRLSCGYVAEEEPQVKGQSFATYKVKHNLGSAPGSSGSPLIGYIDKEWWPRFTHFGVEGTGKKLGRTTTHADINSVLLYTNSMLYKIIKEMETNIKNRLEKHKKTPQSDKPWSEFAKDMTTMLDQSSGTFGCIHFTCKVPKYPIYARMDTLMPPHEERFNKWERRREAKLKKHLTNR